MKKYKLSARVTVSAYTEVMAESLDEAILLAEDRSVEFNDNSYSSEKDSWVVYELDGEPEDIIEG